MLDSPNYLINGEDRVLDQEDTMEDPVVGGGAFKR